VNKLYLVLADSDFGGSLSLSRVDDLLISESEADCEATEEVQDGAREVLLFELKRAYRPRPKDGQRQVEVIYVDKET
jgi:hypothetical protein